MYSSLQFKRGYAAQWEEYNLLLEVGEPGFEVDTGRLKIGNGETLWNDLPYVNETVNIITVPTYSDLDTTPKDEEKLYRVKSEKLLYQWDAMSKKFQPLNGGNDIVNPLNIDIIDGGNANGKNT